MKIVEGEKRYNTNNRTLRFYKYFTFII